MHDCVSKTLYPYSIAMPNGVHVQQWYIVRWTTMAETTKITRWITLTNVSPSTYLMKKYVITFSHVFCKNNVTNGTCITS
jgi:hypothetical protein